MSLHLLAVITVVVVLVVIVIVIVIVFVVVTVVCCTTDSAWRSRTRGSCRLHWSDVSLHLLSVGNSALMFEAWLSNDASHFVFRYSSFLHHISVNQFARLVIHCVPKKTLIRIFFYISVENVYICVKFTGSV